MRNGKTGQECNPAWEQGWKVRRSREDWLIPLCFVSVSIYLCIMPPVFLTICLCISYSPPPFLFVSPCQFPSFFFSYHLVRACLVFNSAVHSLFFFLFVSDATGCCVRHVLARPGASLPPHCIHGLVQCSGCALVRPADIPGVGPHQRHLAGGSTPSFLLFLSHAGINLRSSAVESSAALTLYLPPSRLTLIWKNPRKLT